MPESDRDEMHALLAWIGPLLSRLKRRWVLTGTTLLGGIVAALGPVWSEGPESTAVRVGAGILAALALVADKVADAFDKKLASATFNESERSAEKAISDLNVVLSEAIEVAFLTGQARIKGAEALRRVVARQAASAIGDGSRATYYTLGRANGGRRILGNAVHGLQPGRNDKPDRPFIESEAPDLNVWQLMDRADDEAEVIDKGTDVPSLNWKSKRYETYYSVPVKAKQVQLGMLSVNNARIGSIGGSGRGAVLAMARVMALVIAYGKGPQELKKQLDYHPNVGG